MGTVFVDLDETLLLTLPIAYSDRYYEGGVVFTFYQQPYLVQLRPHAVQFLMRLQEQFDTVALLTAGSRSFQTRAMQCHGLDVLFDELYFREDMTEGPLCKEDSAILIDNADPDSEFIQSKLWAIGCDTELVTVTSWGGSPYDRHLAELFI